MMARSVPKMGFRHLLRISAVERLLLLLARVGHVYKSATVIFTIPTLRRRRFGFLPTLHLLLDVLLTTAITWHGIVPTEVIEKAARSSLLFEVISEHDLNEMSMDLKSTIHVIVRQVVC